MKTDNSTSTPINASEVPIGNAEGFVKYFRQDILSGFLVFLIALPLCIGIALASNFPSLAGVFTAIIGAVLTTFMSNSELTIKGPAAGMIVIVIGCVTAFGGDGVTGGFSETDMFAYRATLAVAVVAGVCQVLFGIFRAGILGEFFPTAAVHGMLAAIGVIIIAKQVPVALGVKPNVSEPLELLREIPNFILEANPAIAAIGIVSLLIMFIWPHVRKKLGVCRYVPAPVIVLIVSVIMGQSFDLLHEHSYLLQGHQYQLGEQYLVDMPKQMFGMFDNLEFPAFEALSQPVAWKWVFMFFMIGSLESLLSAKAVDLLDPWKRRSNLNRDLVAVGTANVAAAFVGGLPMISEIVRSRANIDNGARTRFADFWHGVFLLICVALIPMWLHLIPLAALAAMLVYTGSRLAHPTEFINVYRIGREQFAIFVTTVIAVLATDLLIGIGIGIGLKFIIHFMNGVPLNSFFKPYLDVVDIDDQTSLISAKGSAVFSNWIPFRRQIEQIGLEQKRNLVIDLSNTKLVDHSVMEKLDEMQSLFEKEGLAFEVRGLDHMQAFAEDAHAARKKGVAVLRRFVVMCENSDADEIIHEISQEGVTSYTRINCERCVFDQAQLPTSQHLQTRLEFVVNQQVAKDVVKAFRDRILPHHEAEVCVEYIDRVEKDYAKSIRALELTASN